MKAEWATVKSWVEAEAPFGGKVGCIQKLKKELFLK